MTELEACYLDRVKKLATLAAVLGIEGDRPCEELEAHARKVMADRQRLFTAAASIHASAKPSLGHCYISPAALHRLENALDQAKAAPAPTHP